jgi:hypothetical protein
MKMFKLLGIVSVLVIVLGLALFLKGRHEQQYVRKLIVDGKPVTVSVYKLQEPLRIDILYRGGMDLDAYPWLRSILFEQNNYELTIPESEWAKYADLECLPKTRDTIKKNAAKIKNAVEEDSNYWNGLYNEITHVVWSKLDDAELLSYQLITKKANGDTTGSSLYVMLQRVDGKWKKSCRGASGDRADKIYKANKIAMNAVKDGSLKVRSAKELK